MENSTVTSAPDSSLLKLLTIPDPCSRKSDFRLTLRTFTSVFFLFLLLLPSLSSQPLSFIGGDARATLFSPLIAHTIEARCGMTVLKDEQRLRLDIGRTTDFLAWQSAADSATIVTMGADFFTWTSLRQAEDFHFPVDAVDYLFGIVFNAKHRIDEASTIAARLRISHISAHLVDGSYDKKAMAWRNGQLPRVYSREFFDLIGAWEWENTTRIYAGGQYVYLSLIHI